MSDGEDSRSDLVFVGKFDELEDGGICRIDVLGESHCIRLNI